MLGYLASLFCKLPSFRGKARIFRTVFRFLPYRVATSTYGVKMIRKVNDVTYNLCMVGYGNFIHDIIVRQLHPFHFMDIGANQGLFSLVAAKNPACEGVHAFEPNPSTFGYLVSNVTVNGLESKIVPLCGAITEEGGPDLLAFAQPAGHSGAANMFGQGKEAFTAPNLGGSILKAVFVQCGDAPILAKIDVEGAEESVLNTLRSLGLLDHMDGLIVEVNDHTGIDGHASALLSLLRDEGWVETARDGKPDHFDAFFVRNGSRLSYQATS